jgi:hypothetical protein
MATFITTAVITQDILPQLEDMKRGLWDRGIACVSVMAIALCIPPNSLFLCGPCRVKGRQETSSSQNLQLSLCRLGSVRACLKTTRKPVGGQRACDVLCGLWTVAAQRKATAEHVTHVWRWHWRAGWDRCLNIDRNYIKVMAGGHSRRNRHVTW